MINKLIEYNGNSKIFLDNKHFIWYFLEIKCRKSTCTSKSYERDIKDFFV